MPTIRGGYIDDVTKCNSYLKLQNSENYVYLMFLQKLCFI